MARLASRISYLREPIPGGTDSYASLERRITGTENQLARVTERLTTARDNQGVAFGQRVAAAMRAEEAARLPFSGGWQSGFVFPEDYFLNPDGYAHARAMTAAALTLAEAGLRVDASQAGRMTVFCDAGGWAAGLRALDARIPGIRGVRGTAGESVQLHLGALSFTLVRDATATPPAQSLLPAIPSVSDLEASATALHDATSRRVADLRIAELKTRLRGCQDRARRRVLRQRIENLSLQRDGTSLSVIAGG